MQVVNRIISLVLLLYINVFPYFYLPLIFFLIHSCLCMLSMILKLLFLLNYIIWKKKDVKIIFMKVKNALLAPESSDCLTENKPPNIKTDLFSMANL